GMLNQFIYQGYSALVSHLRAPLGMACVLTFIILGYSIMYGWVKLSMANFVKLAFKIGLIYTFAMHWDIFSHYVVQGISVGAGDIGDWIINAVPNAQNGGGTPGINQALQLALNKFATIGFDLWQEGHWRNIEPYLNAILVWGFGMVMVFLALFE